MSTTNADRAERVFRVLLAYSQGAHYDPNDDLTETVVTDLLADLHHYCEEQAVDLADCFRVAANHFDAETETTK